MLSDEQISLAAHNEDSGDWNDLRFRDCWHSGFLAGARFAVDEVRKQDTELIRQMLEALENHDGNYKLSKSAGAVVDAAITAARARLENT